MLPCCGATANSRMAGLPGSLNAEVEQLGLAVHRKSEDGLAYSEFFARNQAEINMARLRSCHRDPVVDGPIKVDVAVAVKCLCQALILLQRHCEDPNEEHHCTTNPARACCTGRW